MRRLIINADDFGLTPGVNRGIMQTHTEGVVTSTTLMACSNAFGNAVGMAKAGSDARSFSVGCHVVLVDGEPILSPEKVRTLVTSRDGEGTLCFRDSLTSFAAEAIRGRLDAAQIEAEVAAQFQEIRAAGICISHFDAHKHAHLFPSVLKPMLKAARDFGIRALRNPFAPIKPLAFAHLLRRPHLWKRYSEVSVLRGFAQRFRQLVREHDMFTTDGSFGIVVTGALDQKLFDAIIGCVPEGTWELCCHPGYSDADLDKVRTRLHESRRHELNVLTSAESRATIEKHGIELISYWDLQ